MFAPANTDRVERQRSTPITVVIGNPPYNTNQLNENDNNKNREYKVIDKRIKDTFTTDSKATNRNKLGDAYVRFFRWAIDRLDDRAGIVCFISNNGFIEGIAFDGFRKHLSKEFDSIYHFDFKGNARTSGERRRKEAGNIFNDLIRVGVGVSICVRTGKKRKPSIHYHAVGDYWRAVKKQEYLASFNSVNDVKWKNLKPDAKHNWFPAKHGDEYESFVPIGTKDAKSVKGQESTIFRLFTNGVKTNRDAVVYDYDLGALTKRIKEFVNAFNIEMHRFKDSGMPDDIDGFVDYSQISWSRDLKQDLVRGRTLKFESSKVKQAMYRPFEVRYLYFDNVLNEEIYRWHEFIGDASNRHIALSGIGSSKPFHLLCTGIIPDVHVCGDTQCFPFYSYSENTLNRHENITDWALAEFRKQYKDKEITKWDIFYYVYGLLHHPGYRERYADNLKRELPRIPYAPDFRAFSKAGKQFAKLHLDYEEMKPHKLKFVVDDKKPLSYHVNKMRLSKDKMELKVNDVLTLQGIPKEAFKYRLGNRSALDWVIDQYQIKTDKRSGITHDPNRKDDPEYIVRLVGQVIAVSLETVKIVEALPGEFR